MSQSFWQIMSGVRAVELIHTSLLSTSEEGVVPSLVRLRWWSEGRVRGRGSLCKNAELRRWVSSFFQFYLTEIHPT